MTIIRQFGISDSSMRKSLRALMNDDEGILLRDCYNLTELGPNLEDWKRWDACMDVTRKAFGHDSPSRHIRDKKTGELVPSKNTIMYHQILAFLPDECSCNGGPLTPEDCMHYAKEYATRYYPSHQIVIAVQEKPVSDDGTAQYIAHVVINRSDLANGKRLNEGRADAMARTHARHIREMDDRWGLRQVERGVRNSEIHERQNRHHRKRRERPEDDERGDKS